MARHDPETVTADGATATAEPGDRGWEIELQAGTGRLDVATASRLLREATGRIAHRGGGHARWRVPSATPEHDQIARSAGFVGDRRLVQMRRSLPTPWSADLPTRPFRPGIDDDEWLGVNNAAFAWHPEQSDWTPRHLAEQMAEPWFDLEGFLVHPPTGPLKGFCWTKMHRDVEPPMGEIYVIAVDPAAGGQGLGRGLVVAGLDHLARQGATVAMLYTEADNTNALGLYESMGFTIHHSVTVFQRPIEPAPTASDADDQMPTPTNEPTP